MAAAVAARASAVPAPRRRRRVRRQAAAAALVAALLGGCDTWFGETEGPPLPGERISVLQHQQGLTADPQARTEPIVLPPPVVNAAWPQAGGHPSHAMHSLQAGEVRRPAWTASIGSGIASDRPVLPQPVVADGKVFTLDTVNRVSAFDARSGRRLWDRDVSDNDDDDVEAGGIAFDDGRLFVTTGFAKVIALAADTGKVLWRRDVGMPVHAPPTATGGRVFVVTVENQLYALNAADGSDAWPRHQALAEVARLLGGASPAVDGNVVIAPFSSGELLALRADTGRVLWAESLAPARRTDEISALAQIRARPLIEGGRVFAISAGGILAAFDLRNGHRLWDRDIGGQQSPWIAGRQLYQVTNDGQLICVSAETGRIHWVASLPAYEDEKERRGPIRWAGPVLVRDELLLAGSNGEVLGVSAYDGKLLGSRPLADGFSVPPVVAEGAVFLLDDDGELLAFR